MFCLFVCFHEVVTCVFNGLMKNAHVTEAPITCTRTDTGPGHLDSIWGPKCSILNLKYISFIFTQNIIRRVFLAEEQQTRKESVWPHPHHLSAVFFSPLPVPYSTSCYMVPFVLIDSRFISMGTIIVLSNGRDENECEQFASQV